MKRILVTLIALLGTTGALAAPSASRGGASYREQCGSCHNGQPAALGPDLGGIVNRPAGSVPGYRYSGPLKRSAIIWSPEKLRAFLVDPQAVIPGTRMPFSGVPADVAADIALYLMQEKPKPN